MGDLVILNEDEDFVAEQSRKLLKDVDYKEERARPMLGKTFPIVPTEGSNFDENWVRLLSDDGNKWYFPKTTLTKVEGSKWTYIGITKDFQGRESLKSFSLGFCGGSQPSPQKLKSL